MWPHEADLMPRKFWNITFYHGHTLIESNTADTRAHLLHSPGTAWNQRGKASSSQCCCNSSCRSRHSELVRRKSKHCPTLLTIVVQMDLCALFDFILVRANSGYPTDSTTPNISCFNFACAEPTPIPSRAETPKHGLSRQASKQDEGDHFFFEKKDVWQKIAICVVKKVAQWFF